MIPGRPVSVMRKIARLDIGNSAYVGCHFSCGYSSRCKVPINQLVLSIGKTAYFVIVEMALEFHCARSYTGEMENNR